ncbi:hypothetical protein [Nocardia sp. NPDC047648]|uniref:hypothetical protein n=1 Tax=Nocardia sp. NPDC047648 TaxID=3155625 RepID=UPI0033FFB668
MNRQHTVKIEVGGSVGGRSGEPDHADHSSATGAERLGEKRGITMSVVVLVATFVCCALVIRALGTREQTRRPLPVMIEADDARR